MANPKPEARPDEQLLINQMLSYADDPLGFVLFTYPWGKPYSPLQDHKGPRQWQLEALQHIGDHIRNNRTTFQESLKAELLKMAFASGRGIGKTAFLGWLSTWLFSCVPGSTTIVSANTEPQLKQTTFPEIRKWATMAINANWYTHNAMSLVPAPWLSNALRTTTEIDDAYWYIGAKLWSEENPDAFAGPHSQRGMAVIFDEASGIPSNIWPVANGYFTDNTIHRLWVAISNPRKPSGAFFECFNKFSDSWYTQTIDARSVDENDQALYNDIIKQYGADSDEARVEVYGQFPRQGDTQFIGRGTVTDALKRELFTDEGSPLLMGVDPARFGDDNAVIFFRQGYDARSIPIMSFKRCDVPELCDKIIAAFNRYNPDAVFIEGDGVGGGVADILKRMKLPVFEVTMGGRPDDVDRYLNKRTEVWDRMKEWMVNACIPDTERLVTDLTAPEYEYNMKGLLKLEPKDRMKRRGYKSPDFADALAVTFARQVARRDRNRRGGRRQTMAKDIDYDIFASS